MRPLRSRIGSCVAIALLIVGCNGGGKANLSTIAEEGEMVIDFGGTDLPLRIEVMDVYLVDPAYEDRYPETFSINGPDVQLVGEFPRDLRVGYGEDFSRLVGQTIRISAEADLRHDRLNSEIKSLGIAGNVQSGTFVVGRVLGQNPEGAGKVIEGRVTLELDDRTVEGDFAFLAKTWG